MSYTVTDQPLAAKTATRVGVWVEASINGIDVMCPPNERPELLWANYQTARDRKATFVSTNVIPRGAA